MSSRLPLIILPLLIMVPRHNPAAQGDSQTWLPGGVAKVVSAPDDQQPASTSEFEQTQQPKILDVEPAREPSPALKYRFSPQKWELRPGSGMLHYMAAVLRYSDLPAQSKEQWVSWASDLSRPTDTELAQAVASLQGVFDELHTLAGCEDITWDQRTRDLRGPDAFGPMLTGSGINETRTMVAMLRLRVRHQLRQGDFAGAVSSIQDGIRLVEFVNNGETTFQKLVGYACWLRIRDSIMEAIATPGCPNLYWALASIPRQSFDVSGVVLWELNRVPRVLPVLEAAESANWSDNDVLREWTAEMKGWEDAGLSRAQGITLAAVTASVTSVETSRRRLLDVGISEERLSKLPALQIVLIDAGRELRRIGDNVGKAYLLPQQQGLTRIRHFQAEFQKSEDRGESHVVGRCGDCFIVF